MAVRVQTTAFDAGAELNALHAANLGIGAVAGFVGYVRDFNDGQDVAGMFLEHRVGSLEPGEPIVFVGAASAHRDAAFDACRFVMDYLKARAPFWKKETTPSGPRWVEGRASDQVAAGRWSENG